MVLFQNLILIDCYHIRRLDVAFQFSYRMLANYIVFKKNSDKLTTYFFLIRFGQLNYFLFMLPSAVHLFEEPGDFCQSCRAEKDKEAVTI